MDDAAVLAALTVLSNMDRATDDAQADAIALVTALSSGDQLAAALALVTMTDAERLVCILALAVALASCSHRFDIAPADLIRRAET